MSLLGLPDHPATPGPSPVQATYLLGSRRTLADLLRAHRPPTAPAPPLRGPSLPLAPSSGRASSARPAPAARPGMTLADLLRAASVPARGSPPPPSSPGTGAVIETFSTPASDAASAVPPGLYPVPVPPTPRLTARSRGMTSWTWGGRHSLGRRRRPTGYSGPSPITALHVHRRPQLLLLPPGKLRSQRRSRHLPSGTALAILPARTPSQGIQRRLARILSPFPSFHSFPHIG